MPIKDEDLEVIEETVNDIEYFYDEEEEYKRNRHIIRKYKFISVAIFSLMLIVFLTVLGIVRMSLYGTKNILTKSEMNLIEFNKITEIAKDKALDFYDGTASSKINEIEILMKKSTTDADSFFEKNVSSIYNNLVLSYQSLTLTSETVTFDLINDNLNGTLDKNLVPDKVEYENYYNALKFYIFSEINYIENLYHQFEETRKGSDVEFATSSSLEKYLKEMTTSYQIINAKGE